MNRRYRNSQILKWSGVLFVLIGVGFSLFGNFSLTDGVRSLLFFTLQSNIFAAIMLSVFAIDEIRTTKRGTSFIKDGFQKAKYISLVGVMLTFFVFGLILVPVLPITYTLSITSLTLHFIAPIIALCDYLLFDRHIEYRPYESLLGLVPPFYYLIFVIICIGAGITFPPEQQLVPYFFLDYQTYGWFSFANGLGVFYWILILSLLVIFIAYGLIKVKAYVYKKTMKVTTD